MGGGALIQLENTGAQDTFLTENPDVDVFEYQYAKYYNFAQEMNRVEFNEVSDFGRLVTCTIPRLGDLISKVYLRIQIPALVYTSGTYASWTESLGFFLIDSYELEIGGQVQEKNSGRFLDIMDEYETSYSKRLGRNLMTLKSDFYVVNQHNAETGKTLDIPLEFFFTKNYGMSLPICAINYQEVKIKIKFRDFNDCLNYDGSTPPLPVSFMDSCLYIEYALLDQTLLTKYKTKKHMYLIEQVQSSFPQIINPNSSETRVKMNFNNAIKEIIFVFVGTDSENNNDWFNYQRRSDNASFFTFVNLLCDGNSRFDVPEQYPRLVFPQEVHTSSTDRRIYCLPFSLIPESNQPSGTMNFSRFDNAELAFKMTSGNPECKCFVFAISYNVAYIEDGKFYVEFAV